ncbi:MAG: MTAP family purine nucleoside phosphorylase [Candidatus Thermoplasmatota archaeon]|nr:MTAP family purine nucleoside phosphorylase [Candidatus Thermoplasmatota archaeon]
MIGVIGGTGLYRALKCIDTKRELTARTPYGICEYVEGKINNDNIIFIARHTQKKYPPHKINHRSNIFLMKKLGINKIISVSAVGSLRAKYKVGSFALPEQLIDFTKQTWTFNDREAKHANFAVPFCKKLSNILELTANELNLEAHSGGTYICFAGPQFETKAELKMARLLGADFVGMTIAPEAKLARELAICYQPIVVITNKCNGKASHEEAIKVVEKLENKLNSFVEHAVIKISESKLSCNDCRPW